MTFGQLYSGLVVIARVSQLFISCSIRHTQKLCSDGEPLTTHRGHDGQFEHALAARKFYWAFATLEATLTGKNTGQKKPPLVSRAGALIATLSCRRDSFFYGGLRTLVVSLGLRTIH